MLPQGYAQTIGAPFGSGRLTRRDSELDGARLNLVLGGCDLVSHIDGGSFSEERLLPRLLASHWVAGGLRLGAHLPFGHGSLLVETLSLWPSMSALKHGSHKATGSLREAEWADSATEQPVQTLWASGNSCPIEPIPRRLDRSPVRRHSSTAGSREEITTCEAGTMAPVCTRGCALGYCDSNPSPAEERTACASHHEFE